MAGIVLSNNVLNPNGFWDKPILENFIPTTQHLALFDQNGYDLTELEKLFAESNLTLTEKHRTHRTAIKHTWFAQQDTSEGAILNHSLLFERKGYAGNALAQLKTWSNQFPRIWQLIQLRPKWGLDFSMDYADRDGNCFEILHWEYDGFDYNEIEQVKQTVEPLLLAIDWDDAAHRLLTQKDKWHHLDFFAQSDYKCKYFGVVKERFKMVAWN